MRRYFFIVILVSLSVSCSSVDNKKNTNNSTAGKAQEKQLNISILLDLSDRIDPQKYPATPEHFQRDIENIKYVAEVFKSNMERLGAYKAKGKIRIFFSPPPANTKIDSIASKLNIDCSKMDNKGKKEVYDSVIALFKQNLDDIYRQAIATSNWEGCDIWRFFKDDVKDFCIDDDSNYRNVLIIFTDGYLYHKQSVYSNKNRFSYLLDKNLGAYRKPNWKQIVSQNDFGIMSEHDDLNNLEVLVLEISAENPSNKIDEDIISYLWKSWFAEMNISRYEVYRSDLPTNTKTRIENFLRNK